MQLVPLGIVKPNTTATAVNVNNTAIVASNKILFQTIPGGTASLGAGNTAPMYIGTATMDITTGVGVIKILGPGDDWAFGDERDGNLIQVPDLYVKAENSADGVLVTVFKR